MQRCLLIKNIKVLKGHRKTFSKVFLKNKKYESCNIW